jgi:hypothetical protein
MLARPAHALSLRNLVPFLVRHALQQFQHNLAELFATVLVIARSATTLQRSLSDDSVRKMLLISGDSARPPSAAFAHPETSET